MRRHEADFHSVPALAAVDGWAGKHFFHTGHNSGYRSIIVGFAETGQGAAILTNGDASMPLIWEVLRSIAMTYGWAAYQPVERRIGRAERKAYSAFAGKYELYPGTAAEITPDGSKLFMKAAPLGPEATELFPMDAKSKFFVMIDAVAVEFIRAQDGAVIEMIVDAPGQRIRAARQSDR